MTTPAREDVITAVAVALHDLECADRTCSGSALSAYYMQAAKALEVVAPLITGAAHSGGSVDIHVECDGTHQDAYQQGHREGTAAERQRVIDELPERITNALSRLEVHVPLDGPMARKIFAAALVDALKEDGFRHDKPKQNLWPDNQPTAMSLSRPGLRVALRPVTIRTPGCRTCNGVPGNGLQTARAGRADRPSPSPATSPRHPPGRHHVHRDARKMRSASSATSNAPLAGVGRRTTRSVVH